MLVWFWQVGINSFEAAEPWCKGWNQHTTADNFIVFDHLMRCQINRRTRPEGLTDQNQVLGPHVIATVSVRQQSCLKNWLFIEFPSWMSISGVIDRYNIHLQALRKPRAVRFTLSEIIAIAMKKETHSPVYRVGFTCTLEHTQRQFLLPLSVRNLLVPLIRSIVCGLRGGVKCQTCDRIRLGRRNSIAN